jgi:hypothetical protein
VDFPSFASQFINYEKIRNEQNRMGQGANEPVGSWDDLVITPINIIAVNIVIRFRVRSTLLMIRQKKFLVKHGGQN